MNNLGSTTTAAAIGEPQTVARDTRSGQPPAARTAELDNAPQQFGQRLEQRFVTIQRERMQDMPMLNPALQVRAVGFRHWQNQCLGILITPWFMNLILLPAKSVGQPHDTAQVNKAQAAETGNTDADANQRPAVTAKVGDSRRLAFPSGSYLFSVAVDEELGSYQTCSLFSPMDEFVDQSTAIEVAEAIIDALMDDGNRDDSGNTHQDEVQRRWHGEPDGVDGEADGEPDADDGSDAGRHSDSPQQGDRPSGDAAPSGGGDGPAPIPAAPAATLASTPAAIPTPGEPALISRRDLLRGVFRGPSPAGSGGNASADEEQPK